MFILRADEASDVITKPILCKRCNRGRLAKTDNDSEYLIVNADDFNGEKSGFIQLKCVVCGALWSISFK